MSSISGLIFVQDFDASHTADPECPSHTVLSSTHTQEMGEREMEISAEILKYIFEKHMHRHLQESRAIMSVRASPQRAPRLMVKLLQGGEEGQRLRRKVKMGEWNGTEG